MSSLLRYLYISDGMVSNHLMRHTPTHNLQKFSCYQKMRTLRGYNCMRTLTRIICTILSTQGDSFFLFYSLNRIKSVYNNLKCFRVNAFIQLYGAICVQFHTGLQIKHTQTGQAHFLAMLNSQKLQNTYSLSPSQDPFTEGKDERAILSPFLIWRSGCLSIKESAMEPRARTRTQP